MPGLPIGGGMPRWGRLTTASRRLDPTWEFPRVEDGDPLDFKTAFQKVQKCDARPVMLLRDCPQSDKDLSKLSTFVDDERVGLALNWFHLVRVGPSVVDEKNVLHALMGRGAPHMVLFTSDGSERIDMKYMPSSGELWQSAVKILRKEYKNSPEDVVSKWRKILNEFDRLDKDFMKWSGEDNKNPGDERVAAKLDEIEMRRQQLVKEERLLTSLEPRNPEKHKVAPSDESWRDELLKKKVKPPSLSDK
jgi:hypothetical protein